MLETPAADVGAAAPSIAVAAADFGDDQQREWSQPIAGGILHPGTPPALLAAAMAAGCHRAWFALELRMAWDDREMRLQACSLHHGDGTGRQEERLLVTDTMAKAAFALREQFGYLAGDERRLCLRVTSDDRYTLTLHHPLVTPARKRMP